MNITKSNRRARAGPPVIRFQGTLVAHAVEGKPSKTVLELPTAVATKLRGMETIEGTINGHPFRAPFAAPSNGHALRVNDAMLNGARAEIGESVRVAVLGPEPEPKVPPDLQAGFGASRKAATLWKNLTLLARLDWIRWIEGAKTHATRARRVARTIDQLSSGKRRPCCVNFYEYMLERVAE